MSDHRPTTDQQTDRPADVCTDQSTGPTTDHRSVGRWSRLRRPRRGRPTTDREATDRPARTVQHERPTGAGTDRRRNRPAQEPTGAGTDRTGTSTGQRPTDRGAVRAGKIALLASAAVLLTVVVSTPVALSSQHLINWAGSQFGLALKQPWDVLVFIALDAAAATNVLLAVYCAIRGESPGVFRILVWAFAGVSAYSNYSDGTAPGAAPDAWWFFPLMSVAGPGLLEAVLHRVRKWIQQDKGQRQGQMPAFGWRRWMPGIGHFRDTFGAYRTANLLDISTVTNAVTAYHLLCPTGGVRVVRAMREQGVASYEDIAALAGWPSVGDAEEHGTDRPSTGRTDPAPPDHRPADCPTGPSTDRRPTDRTADRTTTQGTARPPTGRPAGASDTDRPATVIELRPATPTGRPADHSDAAIANAATIRRHFGTRRPTSVRQVRNELGWSADRARPAYAAYQAGADASDKTDRAEGATS